MKEKVQTSKAPAAVGPAQSLAERPRARRGASQATRRRGDAIMEDLTCAKELDKASPKIAESVASGKVYPKVEIELRLPKSINCYKNLKS